MNANIEVTQASAADAFVGISMAQAETILGASIAQETFQMSPGVPEFRIELRNIFGADQTPEIREATWSRSEDENLTLWFAEQGGEWTAVHYKSWHPTAEF